MRRVSPSRREPGSDFPTKNEETELPVPSIWRPVFEAIVACFVAGDWELRNAPSRVQRVLGDAALDLRESVAGYGDVSLVRLPPETWDSSVSMWTGAKWDVLVDLWTEQEGRSDLVLHAFVTEAGDDFDFEVHFVYVP